MPKVVVGNGSVTELLAECAVLINNFGPESPEVDEFIRKHSDNSEFVELANLSKKVKEALRIQYQGRDATAPHAK